MEPNENNLFREVQEPSTSCVSEKRSSRSRVWEKVVWFTRKAKGAKDSKISSPEVQKSNSNNNNNTTNCRDCKTPGEGKSDCKQKVRKTRSFKYLKRRKVRQFGDDLCSVAVEEDVNLQDCGTATGTFHDFKSERRISRHERTPSNNSLLCEIARGMNSSKQRVKENVKSVLSLPLDDLSLNEGPNSDSLSPSFPRVRRSVSFSGPAYNSWPRKKRTHLKSSVELLSPPVKQKCVSAIRKRASFNGFDSSKLTVKNSYMSLVKGVKSTPHLSQGGQIRNQNGLNIGAIHFYKSPVIFQKDDTTLKLLQRRMQPKQTNGESATGVHCVTHGSVGEKGGEISALLSKKSDKLTYRIPEKTEKHEANVHSDCSFSNVHNCNKSNLTCKEQIDTGNVSGSCANNCISFHVKNSDMQNATISAFLLEGECSSSCITTSPVDSSEEDLIKEKPLLSPSAAEDATSVHSSDQDNILTEDGNITYTMLESKTTCEDGSLRKTNNGSVEAMDIPECCGKAPDFKSNESIRHSSENFQESSHSANVSEVVSTDDEIDVDIFSVTQCNTEKALSSCSLPSLDDLEVSKVDVIPSILGTNGNLQSLQTGNEMMWQRKPMVNGAQFKKHTEVKLTAVFYFFSLNSLLWE